MIPSIIYKYLLFFFLAIAFFLPEYYLPILEHKMGWQAAILDGETDKKDKPVFIPQKWLIGQYQKQYEAYLKDYNPVRDLLVRTRNQLEFDLLGTIGNQTVLLGKDGMLYSKGYINAVFSENNKSKEWIANKVQKLRFIIDYFEKRGIHFLVVTPPSKARVYPNKLPSTFHSRKIKKTNRSIFLSAFKKYDIPVIDFEYFITYETETQLPIYPQAGLHWNYLGVAMAADTIRNYLATHYELNLPSLIWPDTIPFHTDFEATDTELLRSINLLKEIELNPQPYPIIDYSELPDSLAPKTIVIGDSYYQILLNKGYHKALFQAGSPYWYYFEIECLDAKDGYKKIDKSGQKIIDQLEAVDLIILSSSEGNLTKFGFGFIDYVYEQLSLKGRGNK